MNTEKLLQLANHLRTGPLFFKWDFTRFRVVRSGAVCGCACSEMSELFQQDLLNHWLDRYAKQIGGIMGMPAETLENVESLVRELLGLQHEEFEYLFVPRTDNDSTDCRWLTEQATPDEVAALIEHYVQTGQMLTRSEDELETIDQGDAAEVSNCVNKYA